MSSCLFCTRISRSMLRHLAEHVLHQIEPGAVLRNEDERKALRPTRQVALRFLRDMGGVIV